MLQKKEKFKCQNCGYCCTMIVLLSDEDIKRIEDAGYKKEEFLHTDALGRKRIRMKNYYCHFLGLHKGETFCRIHNIRPKICRDYPFLEDGTAECMPPSLFEQDFFGKGKKK